MPEERTKRPFFSSLLRRSSLIVVALVVGLTIGGVTARSVFAAPKVHQVAHYSSFVGTVYYATIPDENCSLGDVGVGPDNYGGGANDWVYNNDTTGGGTPFCAVGTGYLGLASTIYNTYGISCASTTNGIGICNGWYRIYLSGVGHYVAIDGSVGEGNVTQICIQCGSPP